MEANVFTDNELGLEKAAKKSKRPLIIGVSLLAVGIAFVFGYTGYQEGVKVTPIADVTIEYGAEISKNASDYFNVGSLVKDTILSVSEVNVLAVGEYEVVLTTSKGTYGNMVTVVDTVVPAVVLKTYGSDPEYVVGKAIAASDLIEGITDLAGIESVTFKDAVIEQDEVTLDANTNIPNVSIKYDVAGIYENAVIAVDGNGNETIVPFEIEVVEDYASHVKGIADITVEVGTQREWLTGIEADEKIKEIQVDASQVNVNEVGEYILKYTIVGDNDKTKIVKEVKVKVVTAETAQEMANAGELVYTSTGQKAVVNTQPNQTEYDSSGNTSYSWDDNNGGSSNTASTDGNGNPASGGGSATVEGEYLGENNNGGYDIGGGGEGKPPWE